MFKKAVIASTFTFAFAASIFAAGEARADETTAAPAAAPAAPAPATSLDAKAPSDTAASTGESASNFKSVTITANPLSLALMRIGLNVEYLPATHHAIVVNPFFQSLSLDGGNGTSSSYKNFGGEIGYHYYTGSKGANGFFVGPSVFLMNSSSTATTNGQEANSSIFVYGVALDVGGQHVFDNGFTIGAGAGAMYLAANGDAANTSSTFKVSGVLPRVLFTLGYSF